MSETYRVHFKKAEKHSLTLKAGFEITSFCNNRFNSANQNVISRILNTFISAINDEKVLPKYVVFVLDDEIIQFLKYKSYGVSTMYGTLLEWLVKNVDDAIQTAKKNLPSKAVNEHYPQLYWVAAFQHKNFKDSNSVHAKYNLCLESIIKLYPSMHVLRGHDFWKF